MNKNNLQKFWEGKGFYLALLIVIIGAALASFLSISAMMQRLQSTQEQQIAPRPEITHQEENTIWNEPFADAEVKEENVPIEPHSTSSEEHASSQSQNTSASPPVSSTAQQNVQAPSEVLQQPPELQTAQAAIWVWPLKGSTLQGYSANELVYNETMGDWRTHNGIDIKADVGTTINAPTNAKVLFAENDALWGGIVELQKDDIIIRICGIDDIKVKEGDDIKQGAQLGKSGEIPVEAELDAHVHIEVKQNGEYIDPLAFFSMNAEE